MFLRFLFVVFFYSFSCFSLTLEKMNVELSYPWGMTWIDSINLLITEKKSKEIILFDTKNNTSTKIKHEIPVAVFGQGGLLDIISEGNIVWVTCSIQKKRFLTTAIFTAVLFITSTKIISFDFFSVIKRFAESIQVIPQG